MRIIKYEAKYRQDFIDFNTAWIVGNFGALEKEDIDIFNHIDDELASGAMIFFAIDDNGAALATCMTKPKENGTWEICKLGSSNERPHKGCGSAVFSAAMDWAVTHGASRLFVVSNNRLKPALHIYKKFGFREIKIFHSEYKRGDIAFEKVV